MDNQRGRSAHYSSHANTCLQSKVQAEKAARSRDGIPSPPIASSADTSIEDGSASVSSQQSFPNGGLHDDLDEAGTLSESDHALVLRALRDAEEEQEESNLEDAGDNPYYESDEDLDAESSSSDESESECSSSEGTTSSPERSGSDDDPDGDADDPDADEEGSYTADPQYIAQMQLESFLGQPTMRQPLPEDLDLTYRILDVLQSVGAPLSCFEKIVDLTRRAHKMQAPLKPVSRKKVMAELRARYSQQELTPHQTELQLPSGLSSTITTIDFCAALGSLLSDPVLMKDENLQFYETEAGSPLGAPPQVVPDELVDILDGAVCREAYRLYIKTPGDLLVPIILFLDKTHLDRNGRLTLEPVCMTLGIFKKECRRNPEFWRTLGFVNTFRDKTELDPLAKLRDYHYVLAHILQSFKDAQRMDLSWTLHYKGLPHDVKLKLPLLYVVGDTEGHDKLCNRYQNRTNSAALCRYCACPREETGNPNASFRKTNASVIAKLVEQANMDELQNRSYHCVENAFLGFLFCDPIRGINGATPAELLHVVEHGLENYLHLALLTAKKEEGTTNKPAKKRTKKLHPVQDPPELPDPPEPKEPLQRKETDPPIGDRDGDTDIAKDRVPPAPFMSEFQQATKKSRFSVMAPSTLKMVDAAAKQYGQCLVHQSDREYHRAYFKDGISSTASKQGHEERMVLLLFLIIFSSSMFPKFKKEFGSEKRLSLYVLVLSHMFMLEDLMKKDSIARADVELLQKYIPNFLDLFKRATDREEGMGMNIIKFHLLTHLAEDIIRFGPSTGYDSSFCESMHKMYKLDAHRTQKRTDDSFQYQTAKRSCERIAIACGMRAIRWADTRSQVAPVALEPVVNLFGAGSVRLQNETQRSNCVGPPILANEWNFITSVLTERDLRFTSMAYIHGILYRAQWWIPRYDWAYVQWEDYGKVVARFKCFFELESGEQCSCVHTGDTFNGPGSFALAEAFTQDYSTAPPEDSFLENFQAHSASSLLFHMDLARDAVDVPQLFVVDLEKMVLGPAAVVPFDTRDENPVDWLVIAPKWEREVAFRDNMEELVKNSSAHSRKRKT